MPWLALVMLLVMPRPQDTSRTAERAVQAAVIDHAIATEEKT